MASGRKIGIASVATSSLGFAFGNFFTLLRLGWLPLTISTLLTNAGALQVVPDAPEWYRNLSPELFLGASVISLFVWAIFPVAIHRLVLVDDQPPKGLFYFRFTFAEFLYAITPIFMAIIPVAIVGGTFMILSELGASDLTVAADREPNIGSPLSIAAMVVSVLIAIYISIRLALMLPLAATQSRIRMFRSWSLMGGNVWRLFFASLLLGLLLIVMFIVLVSIFGLAGVAFVGLGGELETSTEQFSFWPVLGSLLITGLTINLLGTIAGIALLSFAYDQLADESLPAGERIKALREQK